MMKIILSIIIAAALGFFSNVASNFVTPHLEKQKRLVWSILVGLIALSIVFVLIPERPSDNGESKIPIPELTPTPENSQPTAKPVATYWAVAGSSEIAIVTEGSSSSLFSNRLIITVTRLGDSDVDFTVGSPTFMNNQILNAQLGSITYYDAQERYEIRLTDITTSYAEFLVTPLVSRE